MPYSAFFPPFVLSHYETFPPQAMTARASLPGPKNAGSDISSNVSSPVMTPEQSAPADELIALGRHRFSTVMADPPWRFANRTGKMAPEHRRLFRYSTMELQAIRELPVAQTVANNAHLYLWVPNALVPEGLQVMTAWGFRYVSNLVWYKVRKDGGPDGRGMGFYFRNVTEMLLFGVRGRMRTLPPGRRQTNIISTRKGAHSVKPDEQYRIIESCSPGPYLELFARRRREGWAQWGNEAPEPSQIRLLD